jgi:hypothetical protein
MPLSKAHKAAISRGLKRHHAKKRGGVKARSTAKTPIWTKGQKGKIDRRRHYMVKTKRGWRRMKPWSLKTIKKMTASRKRNARK